MQERTSRKEQEGKIKQERTSRKEQASSGNADLQVANSGMALALQEKNKKGEAKEGWRELMV